MIGYFGYDSFEVAQSDPEGVTILPTHWMPLPAPPKTASMHELPTRLPLFVPGFVDLDLCIQHVSIAVKQGRSRNKKTHRLIRIARLRLTQSTEHDCD
jgi:Protein of unknown function (DUF551)